MAGFFGSAAAALLGSELGSTIKSSLLDLGTKAVKKVGHKLG
jgi:hypothetical protein